MATGKSLTKKQINYIQKHSRIMTGTSIADKLNVGRSIVNRYIREHQIGPTKAELYKWRGEKVRRPFTDEEKAFIKANIEHMSIKKMAKLLHRTAQYVSKEAKLLGFESLIIEKQITSLYRKGFEPANKGKKMEDFMTPEQAAKFRANMFKKGQLPHNAKEKDGVITIRKDHDGRSYQWIRVSLGNWKLLHRHIWEKEHGPIPAGHCLWFKNGNSLDCVLSNLELITRKENSIRNSGSVNLTDSFVAKCIAGRKQKDLLPEIEKDKSLIAIKRAQFQLRRKIKQHEQ